NGGEPEVYCGSSDWMPRNFRRRVEVLFPVLDEKLKARIRDEILETMASDNVKGWVLGSNGRYERVTRAPDGPRMRSQEHFMAMARKCAHVANPTIRTRGLKPTPVRESTLEKLRRKRRRQ